MKLLIDNKIIYVENVNSSKSKIKFLKNQNSNINKRVIQL